MYVQVQREERYPVSNYPILPLTAGKLDVDSEVRRWIAYRATESWSRAATTAVTVKMTAAATTAVASKITAAVMAKVTGRDLVVQREH